MAKKLYTGINDTSRNSTKLYIGISDLSRKAKKAYIGVNNLSRLFWESDVKPVGAIYWHGDLCTDITGGWETAALPSSWSGANLVEPTVSYSNNSVAIEQSAYTALWENKFGQWKTVNRIDLSNYTKCNIRSTGYLQKGNYAQGMHAIFDFYLHDNLNDYIDANHVNQYNRTYVTENDQLPLYKTWTDEVCSFNLNSTVLSKGLEYFILCADMNTGRGTITISEIWFD